MPRLSRALAAATGLLLLGGVLVTQWAHLVPDPGHTTAWCGQLATALTYGFVGTALGERVRAPATRIAVLLQSIGLSQAAGLLAGSWSRNASLPGGRLAAWFDAWVWVPGVLPGLLILPLLFPTGQLPGRRWRPAMVATVALCVVFTGAQAATAWPGSHVDVPFTALTVAVAVSAVVGVVSLVVRFIAQDAAGRAQTTWLAWAVAVLLVFEAVQGLLPRPVSAVGLVVLPLLVPVAVGVAVSRFRLYDVDLVVSRTATYAVLTAVLTAGYLAAVVALGLRTDSRSGAAAEVLALLMVALVAMPLRGLVQGVLDRKLLGDRSPQVAVGRLARRLRDTIAPDTVPASVVRTVRESLRVPYARLVIAAEDGVPLLAVEEGRRGPGTDLTLRYAGRQVGTLTVGWRTPTEPFGQAELRMLAVLAEAAAPALDGLLLAAELRRARDRAARVREEERDRLRRDLHDGLGPTLGGIALGLQAVANLIEEGDHARTRGALDRLRELASGAIEDIRSLARGLRPSALDSIGLVETIHRHAGVVAAGITVHVQVDGDLTGLPEAVEVATLHIALEALTNVRRHSGAQTCWVRLERRDGQLELEVDDDGCGPDGQPAPEGVGRSSMRTRVAELGGTSSWGPSPRGGVAVRATLPVVAVSGG